MTPRFNTATALPRYVLQQGVNRLRVFRCNDDGAMTYPTISSVLMMLGIVGIRVDFLRMVRYRLHMQATPVGAVLAAV